MTEIANVIRASTISSKAIDILMICCMLWRMFARDEYAVVGGTRPFEVVLETPQAALVAALRTILAQYRELIAYAPNL